MMLAYAFAIVTKQLKTSAK